MKNPLEQFIELIKGIDYKLNEPLASYTTFKIGGPADILVTAVSEDQAHQVLQAASQTQIPLFILGGGSNLLISDEGFRGCMLHLSGKLSEIKASDSHDEIWVGAGASFPKLTRKALTLGWECALGFCGTPGQVGGALKMNAGTRLGEIGEVVHEVNAVTAQGQMIFSKKDITFSYRKTSFPENIIITKAVLKYAQPDKSKAAELLKKAEELAQKRKASQPKLRSAGSIFKNPANDFAGRLIEKANLKGLRVNDAEVSQTHANFIVNVKNAQAQDIFDLAKIVKQEVYKKFNISLEYEVKLVGTFKRD